MSIIDEKIKEIASGYGALTGRPPGWEAYISLQDYALLRDMATGELARGTPTVSLIHQTDPKAQNGDNAPVKKKPKTASKTDADKVPETAPAETNSGTPINIIWGGKTETNDTNTSGNDTDDLDEQEESELDLLISLGKE